MELLAGERLDDLQINGLKLIQNKDKYCFTSDAVLLANLTAVNAKSKVLDIGCGSGIISILLAGKKNAGGVTAVEIQQDMAELAERNVKLNNLDDKIAVVCDSIQHYCEITAAESYDVIVCNPPYKKPTAGEMDKNEARAIGKYELKLSLLELCVSASRLLKYSGKFYMVHRADRLAECVYELKLNKLEPKKMWLIQPTPDKPFDTVIFECVKGGKVGLNTETLLVYNSDGNYTQKVKSMYYKD